MNGTFATKAPWQVAQEVLRGLHARQQSRRNLARTNDRAMWKEARKENHMLRYRLYFPDDSCNLKCDRITLLAEIRERKPLRIERIPPKDTVSHFASEVGHQYLLGKIELVEVEDGV